MNPLRGEIQKYNVRWTCPHCGNHHNWWWEDEWEAYDESPSTFVCDRCMKPTECTGDGRGFFKPVNRVDNTQMLLELQKAVNSLAKRVCMLEVTLEEQERSKDCPPEPQKAKEDAHVRQIYSSFLKRLYIYRNITMDHTRIQLWLEKLDDWGRGCEEEDEWETMLKTLESPEIPNP